MKIKARYFKNRTDNILTILIKTKEYEITRRISGRMADYNIRFLAEYFLKKLGLNVKMRDLPSVSTERVSDRRKLFEIKEDIGVYSDIDDSLEKRKIDVYFGVDKSFGRDDVLITTVIITNISDNKKYKFIEYGKLPTEASFHSYNDIFTRTSKEVLENNLFEKEILAIKKHLSGLETEMDGKIKKCLNCSGEFSCREFLTSSKYKAHSNPYCKSCRRARGLEYYNKNRKNRKEYAVMYRDRPLSEKMKHRKSTKECNKCRQVKKLEFYGNHAQAADGLRGSCKVCINKRNSEWRDNHQGYYEKYFRENPHMCGKSYRDRNKLKENK